LEKPPIPNHTAPPQQQPKRTYDAELFNDWLN
jgi:hypothetical protein